MRENEMKGKSIPKHERMMDTLCSFKAQIQSCLEALDELVNCPPPGKEKPENTPTVSRSKSMGIAEAMSLVIKELSDMGETFNDMLTSIEKGLVD